MKDAVVIVTCLWFIFISWVILVFPEAAGAWQANVEFAFVEEADRLGLWGE